MENENRRVIHPPHYSKSGKPECWDWMIDTFGVDAVIIFDVLNAAKYFYRRGEKDGSPTEEDTEKMNNYMNHAWDLIISHMDEKQPSSSQIYHTMLNILEKDEVDV